MKSKLKMILIGITMTVLMAAAVIFYRAGGAKITDGTYKIVGNSDYPNAVLQVQDGNIQFEGIDFNSVYGEQQMTIYNNLLENGNTALNEEELENYSDLNAAFVSNVYVMDYSDSKNCKIGTFTYSYGCYRACFGFTLVYDAFNKTVTVTRDGNLLKFKRVGIL